MVNCWQEIGIAGDQSCPVLETVTHCYNCKVYGEAGQSLFERPAPEGYLEEWLERLAKPRSHREVDKDAAMVAVFRLGNEVLGLPAKILQVIVSPNPVHHIPHRSDGLFRGLVNIQGKLLLCVALEELLHLHGQSFAGGDRPKDQGQEGRERKEPVPQMVVMEQKGSTWAFTVDEFYGVEKFLRTEQTNPPSLSSQTLESFTQYILPWRNRNVSYLDAQQVFESLRKHIL
jgi:chemotaxis-related protein WspD